MPSHSSAVSLISKLVTSTHPVARNIHIQRALAIIRRRDEVNMWEKIPQHERSKVWATRIKVEWSLCPLANQPSRLFRN